MFIPFQRYFAFILIIPLISVLTACNDSKDDQAVSHPDPSKKPVMRCAP
ncbi:hypothetical protein [Acinetobacter sp. ANC 4648]|nr:hypothetical protein [Acinetobacter sp. ANC 4648]